jgi:hypothetical protein
VARRCATGAEINNATSTGELDAVSTTTPTGTGGAPSALFETSASQAYSGSRSWHGKVVQAGTETTSGSAKGTVTSNLPTGTAVTMRGRFFIPAGLSNNQTFVIAGMLFGVTASYSHDGGNGTSSMELRVAVDGSGNYTARGFLCDSTSSAASTASVAITAGAWHSFVLRTDTLTGTNPSAKLTMRIDATTTTSAQTAQAVTAGSASSVDCGIVAVYTPVGSGTSEAFIDDLIVDDTNADITDGHFLVLIPPASDDVNGHSQWSGTPPSGTKYGHLSDQSDSTYIFPGTVGATNIEELGWGSPGGTGAPQAVYGWARSGHPGQTDTWTFEVRDQTDTAVSSAAIAAHTTTTTDHQIAVASIAAYARGNLSSFAFRLTTNAGATSPVTAEVMEVWAYAELFTTAYSRGVSETASSSDTAARVLASARGVSESITGASDAESRALVQSRAISESAPPSDAESRALVQSRAVSETVAGLSDATTRALVQARATSETVTSASDSEVRALVQARSLTETATASDAITRQVARRRAAAEAVSTSDSPGRALAQARGSSEALAVSDAVTRSLAQGRNDPESASASDSVSRALTQGRQLNEATTISDASTRDLSLRLAVSEALPAPTDSVSRVTALGRAIGETASATDAEQRALTQSRGIGETASVSDTPMRHLVQTRSISESVPPPVDAWARFRLVLLNTLEQLQPATDAIARAFTGSRGVAESMTTTDAASRQISAPRSVSESTTVSDSVARAAHISRGITEHVEGTDGVIGPLPLSFIHLVLRVRAMAAAIAVRSMATTLRVRDMAASLLTRDMTAKMRVRDDQEPEQLP